MRVFSSPEGELLRRHNFRKRTFKPTLRRAGLDETIRFHDLRHSGACNAIASGANVKQVQEMLGHSSATVTLDVYAHFFPNLADALRDRLDAAYQEVKSKRDGAQKGPERGREVVELARSGAENAS
jgi:site-specific recombinase XerD